VHIWEIKNLYKKSVSHYRDKTTGWMTGVAFPTGAMTGFFFIFATTSRPALGPTQSPNQWKPEAYSGGKAAGS